MVDLDLQMKRLKRIIKKALKDVSFDDPIDIQSKTDVLPILKFKSKCGSTVFVNCYQIVAVTKNNFFKFSLITQSKSWDISRYEYNRILKKISK